MRFRLNLRGKKREGKRAEKRGALYCESANFLNAGPRDISWPPTLLTLILYTMTSEIVARPSPSPSFQVFFIRFRRERDENSRATFFNWNLVDFFPSKRSRFFVRSRLSNRIPAVVIVEGVRRCSTQQGYNVSDMRISDGWNSIRERGVSGGGWLLRVTVAAWTACLDAIMRIGIVV